MKSSRTHGSKSNSRGDPRQLPARPSARRKRRILVPIAATPAPAQPKAALAAPDEAAGPNIAPGVHPDTVRHREETRQPGAEQERLWGRMRAANGRLVVAAVEAQDRTEDAQADAARTRLELDDLMRQLHKTHARLATAAAQAHVMAEEARQHEKEYRRLSGRLLQLQDDERRRLAVDLHDSMGQRLAALTMNLDLVERAESELDPGLRHVLEESRTLAEQCTREVRTLAYLLHPPLLDEMGLVSALRWYTKGFIERSGIHVVMNLDEIGRMREPIETALFRVVQESLTNVHRHASATTAAGAVVLEITDQGHGLRDSPAPTNETLHSERLGVGIQGMRERIHQLGGTFDIQFTDTGTAVRASVPLGKAPREDRAPIAAAR